MYRRICLKKIFKIFYIVMPLVFYGIPLILSLDAGFLRMHFFGPRNIESSYFLVFFLTHAVIGLAIYWTLSKLRYELYYKTEGSLSYGFLLLILYISKFVPLISYLSVVLNSIFLILIASYRPRDSVFGLLFLISLYPLFFQYDRFPVIFILIIWFLPLLSSFKLLKLSFLGFVGILFLIFVLQPLRGHNLPFIGSNFEFFYLAQHLFPIYLGAYFYVLYDFNWVDVLAETLPLLHFFLGKASVIDIMGFEYLPRDVYYSGLRHGSNSSIYYGWSMFLLAPSFLFLHLAARYVKYRLFSNALVLSFVLYGPYFVRRLFASQVQDIVLLLAISMFVGMFILVLKGRGSGGGA